MTRSALAFLLLLSACHPSTEPSSSARSIDASAPPVVVASVAPSVSAAPAPPASASGSASVVAAEEPKEDLTDIALAMCAATFREEGDKRIIGCRKPPPFKGAGRATDGKMPKFTSPDISTFCGISIGGRGSFSAPGKKELLVVIENCRDESDNGGWNGSMPGSAAIVANEEGRWRPATAIGGVNAGDCRVLRRSDGRDTLMCQSRYDAFSIGTAYYFFSLDFAGGKGVARTVAHLFDDIENWNCVAHDGSAQMAPTGVTGLKIAGVKTTDVNADGTPDLVVEVARAHAEPSAKLDARLRTLCKQGKPIDEVLPAPTTTTLEILSDGTKWKPVAATKKLLDKWRAESPDVTQLEGAAPPK